MRTTSLFAGIHGQLQATCLRSTSLHIPGVVPAKSLAQPSPSSGGHLAQDRAAKHFQHRAAAMRSTSTDASNAWIPDGPVIEGATSGPLHGLTFAAKDLYDVEGFVTGFGQPTWAATHAPAAANAPAVQALLDAGARLVGKTHMDELAYSLNGENAHYGTPINPACPDRIPGGSSSGSAVAVANGEVDLALGSDTGGSVRVPASFCGILGLRPTHGRVSLQGACTLAASYDTGGYFARSAEILRRAGDVLLDPATKSGTPLTRLLVGRDAFDLADPATSAAIYEAVSRGLDGLKQLLGEPDEVTIGGADGVPPISGWNNIFRVSQGAEVWEALGEWVTQAKPQLGPGTKERFEMASKLQPDEIAEANELRERVRKHVDALLGGNAVLLVPSAAGPAPKLATPQEQLNSYRMRLISLTAIAGLCGLPQVSLPVATVHGCPVGLGVIGPRGSDEQLLRLTEELVPLLVTSGTSS